MAKRRAIVRGLAIGAIVLAAGSPAAAESGSTTPEPETTTTTVATTSPDPSTTQTTAPSSTTSTTAAPAAEEEEAEEVDEEEATEEEATEAEAEAVDAEESDDDTEDGSEETEATSEGTSSSKTKTSAKRSSRARVTSASGSGSSTTTTGQQLNIQVTVDDNGDGTGNVSGQVSIGLIGSQVNVAFVVDISGSTGSSAGDCNGDGVVDAGDDLNSDGSNGEVLDCEIAGVKTINDQLKGLSGVQSGLVEFDDTGAVAQAWTSPDDPAFETAVGALQVSGGTDFDDAITAMNGLYATAPAGSKKVAFFFSDGSGTFTTGPGSAIEAAVAAGIQINTYSVGTGATGCDVGADLRTIADMTGGVCTAVDDPTQLAANVSGLSVAGIEKVTVSLNGGQEVEVPVDLLGRFQTTISGLRPTGENRVLATVTATDGTTATAEAVLTDMPMGPNVPVGPPQGPTSDLVVYHTPVDHSVTSGSGTLPVTGADSGRLAAIALALMAAGLGVTLASRRVRTTA